MKNGLSIRLTNARGTIQEQVKLLKRARRLYFKLIREEVLTSPKPDTLTICAERMKEGAMYAPSTSVKQVRFSILRALWKIETGGRDWWRWYEKSGWVCGSWQKKKDAA